MIDIPTNNIPNIKDIIRDLTKPEIGYSYLTNDEVTQTFADFLDSFFEAPIQFDGHECPETAWLNRDEEEKNDMVIRTCDTPYMRLHEYNVNFRNKKKKKVKTSDYIKTKIDIRYLNIPGILNKEDKIIENLVQSKEILSSNAIINTKVLDIAMKYKYREYAYNNLIK
jgi:hypothetical protein